MQAGKNKPGRKLTWICGTVFEVAFEAAPLAQAGVTRPLAWRLPPCCSRAAFRPGLRAQFPLHLSCVIRRMLFPL